MDIDIYKPCPCNSGKKIKFCCAKDIVADLNQILSKSAAKQSTAAIDLIDNVVERVGQRDCLSIIKTHILLSNDEIEKADQANIAFLKTSPKHPIGLQHRALVKVGQHKVEEAVMQLQKAMNAIPGNEIPVSFANAFRTIGAGLMAVGHLLAARAHFHYALMLREDDERTQQMLIQTYRMPDVSLLLKHDVRLDQPPKEEGPPWRKHFVNAIKALDRGQFLFALKILQKADSETPDVPELKRGIAILTTNLAIESEMGTAWRAYAQTPGLDHWDAAEAEAFAQMLGEEDVCDNFDIVSVTFELSDMTRASEAAIASPRFIARDVPPTDDEAMGPPPRFLFVLLDRDELKTAESMTVDTVPNAVAEILMYGKQTDREARIDVLLAKDSDFDSTIATIKETFAEEISGEPVEELAGATNALAEAMSWNWHLPKDTTNEVYEELNNQMRDKVILKNCPEVTFSIFGGKTLREASKMEEYRVAVDALLIQLEQSSDQMVNGDSSTVALRKELGLADPEMIDPTTLGNRLVSPIKQRYLIIEKLTDEQLLGLQSEAMTIGNMPVLKLVLPEILSRPSTEQLLPHDLCHSVLAQLAEDEETCFEHLKQARKVAVANNRPVGVYLVQELEMSMLRGRTDALPMLLKEIETKHLQEPNVEYQLVRVLQRFGLIGQDGRMVGGPPPGPEATPPAGGVWTGEGPEPVSADAESTPSESKLWIPGQ